MRYFRANAYVIENDTKLYLIDPSLTLKEYEDVLGDNFLKFYSLPTAMIISIVSMSG